jgi:uncharacterized membrane protein YtjA (UPF0391 family)
LFATERIAENYSFGLIVRNRVQPLVLKVEVWFATAADKGGYMLYWALVFFIVAIVAGILGFGGIALAAAGIAKILFFIFLIVFLVTLIMGLGRRGRSI